VPDTPPTDTTPPVLDRRSLIVYVSATALLVVFNYWALPAPGSKRLFSPIASSGGSATATSSTANCSGISTGG